MLNFKILKAMKILNLFFLSLCSLFMIACLDPIDIESNIPEEVVTPEVTWIRGSSVQVNVDYDDAFVLVGSTPNLSEKNAIEKVNKTSTIGLEPNTTYYYKMIRRRGGYDLEGDVKSFTTPIEVGYITISSLYSGPSESEQPTICSNLLLNGANIKEAGFCFSQEYKFPMITNCEKKVVITNSNTSRLESKACLENGVKGMMTYVRAYCVTEQDTVYSEESALFYLVSGFKDGYPYIDLGLPSGLKWAVYNEGADEPRTFGDLIQEKMLTWDKYSWGEKWRLPTHEEALEFASNCVLTDQYSYTLTNSKISYIGGVVKGKNGNVIYMPYGGWNNGINFYGGNQVGYFWLSTKLSSDDKCQRTLSVSPNKGIRSYYYLREENWARVRYVTE